MLVWSLAKKELRLLLKERGTFFWLVLLPILFIVLFGAVFSSAGKQTTAIPFIDNDQTAISQSFIKSVGNAGGFKLSTQPSASLQQQIDKISKGKQPILIVIPKGFGAAVKSGVSQAPIEVYADPASSSIVSPVVATLENVANGYREAKIRQALKSSGVSTSAQQHILMSPIKVVTHNEHAAAFDIITQIVPGYTVMFVFFILISMIRRFIRDKETGMTARLRSTRMTPFSYLAGMWIPYVVVTLIQCAILMTFGHLVYGVHLGNVVAVSVILVMLSLCATAIGLALSMVVRSENQGIGFTQLLAMGGAALGGLWFPTDLMPHAIQVIGEFTPQYWAQKGLQDIMLRGSGLGQEWPSLAVLLGFAALGLVIALMRFRSFIRAAV